MANTTLIINDVDFSDYIQQETDIEETMVKVVGPAQDTAIDGTTIPDLVKIKWNPSFRLKPMARADMNVLINLMQLETVTLQYTSIRSSGYNLRTIEAMPVSMKVQYAKTQGTYRIYADTPISFEEV